MQRFKEFWLLDEVESINIKRTDKFGFNRDLGKNVMTSSRYRFAKATLLGNFSHHNVYKTNANGRDGQNNEFLLTDHNDILKIVLEVTPFNRSKKVLQVNVVAADKSNTIPTQKFYAWLLKNQDFTLVSGEAQSPGGKKVWERLSMEPGIGVHGWVPSGHGGRAVNLGPKLSPETEDETHISWRAKSKAMEDLGYKDSDKDWDDLDDIEDMLLVAFKK